MNIRTLYATNRLSFTFQSDLGGPAKSFEGTGFWVVNAAGEVVMITCRHSVDGGSLPGCQKWSLQEIEARGFFAEDGTSHHEVEYAATFPAKAVYVSDVADIACWAYHARTSVKTTIDGALGSSERARGLRPVAVPCHGLVSAKELGDSVDICAPLFITGFPGLVGLRLDRPVAMGGWLASDPRVDVGDEHGVSLTGVFSWNGLSGGLVSTGDRHSPKVVGINTEHIRAKDVRHATQGETKLASPWPHSGLSKMVRAPLIVDLLNGVDRRPLQDSTEQRRCDL